MNKYHFLMGKTHSTKEFETNEAAIEAAKKDDKVLRVQCDKTYKHIYENKDAIKAFMDGGKAALILLLSVAALMFASVTEAATTVGVVPQSYVPVFNTQRSTTNNTTAWGTNAASTTLATNGYYPPSITGGTIVTNFVLLTGGSTSGNNLLITINGTYVWTGDSTATAGNTNVYFGIYAGLPALSIITNTASGSLIYNTNISGVTLWQTLTLPVGSVSGKIYTTNFVFTPATTPAYNAGYNLYLGTIQPNITNTAALTNLQIYLFEN